MATSGSTLVRPDRTVLERLIESGITEDRALSHLSGGWVRVDGKVVTDPAFPATPPMPVEFRMITQVDPAESYYAT